MTIGMKSKAKWQWDELQLGGQHFKVTDQGEVIWGVR